MPVPIVAGLAHHQRLRLRQGVGQHLPMVTRQSVRWFAHGYDFQRQHIRALVQHLKKRMLPVGSRLAPDNRRGGINQGLATGGHALAVAFHFELLQVGRPAPQPGVIRRDTTAGEAMEIAVPDIQHAQPYGQVHLQRRRAKVLVHGMPAGQQPPKTSSTN